MNDMSSVIIPKSDQINADDLIAGPMTITIREVQIRGGQEQPVSIYFDGSDKAYRPCKSMSRVLVQGWGADSKRYVGRSLTLYRDPTVKWAGMEVGGIRISHMSHIEGEKLMMLTATKGSRKPHKVKPLEAPAAGGAREETPREWADKFIGNVGRAPDSEKLEAYVSGRAATALANLATAAPDIHRECIKAIADKRVTFIEQADDDPFAESAANEAPEQPAEPAQELALVDATADWTAKADELKAQIRAAKRVSYVDAVQEEYREVCQQMPKALCDEIEAALAAKRRELGEGN